MSARLRYILVLVLVACSLLPSDAFFPSGEAEPPEEHGACTDGDRKLVGQADFFDVLFSCAKWHLGNKDNITSCLSEHPFAGSKEQKQAIEATVNAIYASQAHLKEPVSKGLAVQEMLERNVIRSKRTRSPVGIAGVGPPAYLSTKCAICFSDSAICGTKDCKAACFFNRCSAHCLECGATYCDAALRKCTGITPIPDPCPPMATREEPTTPTPSIEKQDEKQKPEEEHKHKKHLSITQ
eukprot:GHVU01218881.1.p1 GENE.GHVU01218881.1~~GHVU01218881.1.p1  ORF type:complete len:260 (-),score=27.85 GHVU01218881.1:620-1336(-)